MPPSLSSRISPPSLISLSSQLGVDDFFEAGRPSSRRSPLGAPLQAGVAAVYSFLPEQRQSGEIRGSLASMSMTADGFGESSFRNDSPCDDFCWSRSTTARPCGRMHRGRRRRGCTDGGGLASSLPMVGPKAKVPKSF